MWQEYVNEGAVSTHSRTEAAAKIKLLPVNLFFCFNTQPHGGGCLRSVILKKATKWVSTHSRTEAAAYTLQPIDAQVWVSTHSRTEAAASKIKSSSIPLYFVSTHSRTEAAAHLVFLLNRLF